MHLSAAELCADIRIDVLEKSKAVGFGHLGGTFSVVEILVALFLSPRLSLLPPTTGEESHDFFILSKGHACLAYFCLLNRLGILSDDLLDTYGTDGGLGGQMDISIPGVTWNTGSLGHSVGVGAGIAIAAKTKQRNVVCLIGDAELSEGAMWEAFHLAGEMRLANLITIVDNNGLSVSDEFSMPRLEDKMTSFGWNYLECDGHSLPDLNSALSQAAASQAPTLLCANTVKGKGVSFMESNSSWHHGTPSEVEFFNALKQLKEGRMAAHEGH